MPKKSNRSGFGRDFGGDVVDMARDRPLATAAVAAAAVGAGVSSGRGEIRSASS